MKSNYLISIKRLFQYSTFISLRRFKECLLFLLLASSGCTLERVSYSEIFPENFFLNESDMNKALTALYVPFSSDWGKLFSGAPRDSYRNSTEFTTDIMKCTWTGYEQFYEHWWEEGGSSNGNVFAEAMFKQYNHLTRIKSTMLKIQNCPAPETVKTKALAEAKCLYAWLGIILYDLFGPVPLASDEMLSKPDNDIFVPRLSDSDYSKIMEDYLVGAIAVLPEVQSEWGRVTKGMAKMLLLKLHMINRDFVKAETIARDLYSMEGMYYDLMVDYKTIFYKENVRNKEIIHAVPCGPGFPNFWVSEVLPSDYPYPHEISMWNGYKMSWDFYDTYEPNDKRLETIVSSYVNKTGQTISRGNGSLAIGALPVKYGYDPDMIGETGTIDVIVYRYADVLLSLAECINENQNGPTQEAIDLVNRVRNRSGLNNLSSGKTANKEVFNDAILTERGHEFYCEGLRRQDLIRHNKYIFTSQELYPNSRSAWYKVRFPIPPYYILESKGIVKQNDGY